MIKTAVIGASGFIGRHLWHAYRSSWPDCIGTGFSKRDDGLIPLDITDSTLDLSRLRLAELGYGAVVITAACPKIAYCEEFRDAAYEVNVRGTLRVAGQLAGSGLQIIFTSTDYVFDGTSGGYEDEHPTAPTTEYGRQKAEVERLLPTVVDNVLVVRFSKVYGLHKNDGTLLDEMAARFASHQPVAAADDQFFCPTEVHDVVRAILAIQDKGLRGTINVASPHTISRFDLGCRLARAMAADLSLVQAVKLHDLRGMQGRPLNTSMRCRRLQAEVGATFQSVDDAVAVVAGNWES